MLRLSNMTRTTDTEARYTLREFLTEVFDTEKKIALGVVAVAAAAWFAPIPLALFAVFSAGGVLTLR